MFCSILMIFLWIIELIFFVPFRLHFCFWSTLAQYHTIYADNFFVWRRNLHLERRWTCSIWSWEKWRINIWYSISDKEIVINRPLQSWFTTILLIILLMINIDPNIFAMRSQIYLPSTTHSAPFFEHQTCSSIKKKW